MTISKTVAMKFIRLYQMLTFRRMAVCRFDPSCSNYALESIDRHGAMRGGAYALRRVARCHPWGGYGYDPVPVRSKKDESRCLT